MKFGVVNKSTILNRFVLHTLQRKITHLAVITHKTNIKLVILKGGELEKSLYTNFEGERAPKKNAIFLPKFFKKCPKTAFFYCFSEICQNGGKKSSLGELQKSIWST